MSPTPGAPRPDAAAIEAALEEAPIFERDDGTLRWRGDPERFVREMLTAAYAADQGLARLVAERDDARGERDAYMKSYAGCVAERDRLADHITALCGLVSVLVLARQESWYEDNPRWPPLSEIERVLAETAPPAPRTEPGLSPETAPTPTPTSPYGRSHMEGDIVEMSGRNAKRGATLDKRWADSESNREPTD